MTTSFNVNINDLQYILKQIKIAEASSAAYSTTPKTILQAIMEAYGATAANAAQLPAGLRTVDGTFNNLIPGQSEFGAAGNLFPRLTDPNFQNVNGPGIDFNGDGLIDVINHNYGDASAFTPGTQIKSVADADPRVISNLIVDMSVSNPAAIQAFLNNPLSMEAFNAYFASLPTPVPVPADPEAWLNNPANVAAANLLLKTIPNQSPDIGLSPGFNSWMTFFGQFFDHGLDLVTKGNNGTVYIPLQADDPLYDKGKDGIANNIVQATDGTGNPLYYITDPANTPVGAPPPATTTVSTNGWKVMLNDDGAGADGKFGTADDRPNFMALTRATATIDANGIPQTENTTTAWIDQNQTYTSHASHQVFLREYVMRDIDGVDGNGPVAVATGKLLDGKTANGSFDRAIGNWGEVKAQAKDMLGLTMNDFNVHDAPLLKTDQYGKFIAGSHGFAQVAVNVTIVNTMSGAQVSVVGPTFVEGVAGGLDINALTSANLPSSFTLPPLGVGQAYKVVTMGTGHAFLNDIAHHAAPGKYDADGDGFKESNQVADTLAGVGDDGLASTYDDEMLNAHFVTGDGRGNENIALTSVHSIFHSEHNRLVEANKATLLSNAAAAAPADAVDALAFLNEWLIVDVAAVPTNATDIANLVWDGERLFQAARFGTEMQYQHLVFEEFARRMQPMVDPFIFNSSPDIDPSIVAEFAHTVYRFGHSMLTGTVDRLDNTLNPVDGAADQESLLAAFLNPQMYIASGTSIEQINANLIRGLSRDVGNAIDEFIVPDVRSSLLGLPLDLAALNIARGRDTGIPSLNETRKQLYEGASAPVADLKPYDSWADFGANLKNPASLVNFIAAYGSHASITAATTLAEMRSAAAALVQGAINVAAFGSTVAADLDGYNFVHALGAYAGGSLGGLNTVDLWIGGLAEAHPEFGGMLGTTFNYIFEFQMEQLQFGDRMYYLTRTQGLNILNNLEPNTFSDLVMRNTELGGDYATHLNGALFVTPDYFLELDRKIAQDEYGLREYNGTDKGSDPTWSVGEPHSVLTPNKVMRNYTGTTTDANGHDVGGTIRFTGGEHVVIGGTEGNDKLYSDRGIDTIWGDGGNDYINAGTESDDVFGGEGDDIIEDPFGDDVLRGNQGNDVISEARGADLVFGDEGSDYLMLGQDAAEAFGGEGNDFILGGAGKDFLLGNEGDDWIEGGAGFDTIAGDNSELFFNSSIIGHDVLFHGSDEGDYDAESGDDIMGSGPSVFRYEGMFGFDWGIAKNDIAGVNFDLAIPIFTTIPNDVLRDRFDQVEALSGWKYTDVLDGDDRGHKGGGSSAPDSVPVQLFADHLLTQEGINRIAGFNQWFGGNADGTMDGTDVRQTLFGGVSGIPGSTPISTWRDGNILIGGDGSDSLRGRGGYDLLDGDAWLNVRIKIVVPTGPNAGTYSAESMSTDTVLGGDYAGKVFNTDANGNPIFTSPAFGGATLNSLMLNGTINPGNMSIVRELLTDTTNLTGAGRDVDTAIFQGQFYEYQIEGSIDLNGDGDFDDVNEFGVKRDLNGDGDFLDANEDTTARDVNGDGFISVRDRDTGAVGASHNGVASATSRGNLTDDTDFLRNIEQLQFADGIKVIAGGNSPAAGLVIISDPTPFDGKVTPYVGQVLTARLTNVVDQDGVPVDANGTPTVPYTFEWQTAEFGSNSGWSTIQTSDTYTVRSADPAHMLRAVAVFNDSQGNPERIASAATDNPTVTFSVDENSVGGTVVATRIPFNRDYDSQSINGQPPADVDLATLHHEIDPANNAGGRFSVVAVPGQFDFQGTPLYQLVVNPALNNTGPLDALDTRVLLNYEAPVHTPANQSHQFVDNQYQVVVNSYDAPGGTLVAVRQFTVFLNDVTGEVADIAPVLDLNADATVTTTTNGQYLDNFNTQSLSNSNGTTTWSSSWVETGDGANTASVGQIQIDGGGGVGTNQLRFLGGTTAGEFDGATITRTVNLVGVTSATLSFDVDQNNIDAGETVTVLFAADGVNFTQTVQTITNASSTTGATTSVTLTGPFTANSAIRFVATGINAVGEDVRIDNVNIATVTTTSTFVPGTAGSNYNTSYTENGAEVAIAVNPSATDADNTLLMGATVKLTNAQVGDVLAVGALPAGITSSFGPAVAGEITMYLSGPATLAQFQTAIAAIRFGNPAENNPIPGIRTINVTVSDGEKESNIATASVTVTATDDPTVATGDSIITNTALGTAFVVPEWALLANDVDLDNTLDMTAVSGPTGLTAVLNIGSVTITDTTSANGSFTYTATGSNNSNANVNVMSIAALNTTTYSETFGDTSYTNNDGAWNDNWAETGDDGSSTGTNGQIRINNNRLEFDAGNNGGASNGAVITRTIANLAGATSATLTYAYTQNIDAGESVLVEFSADGTTFTTVQTITNASANGTIPTFTSTGPFTANATLRFTVSTMNVETTPDVVSIDNISIAFTRPAAVNGDSNANILIGDVNGSTFNGGGGNDTIFAGAENDTINWNVGGGRDFVDGQVGTVDRFVITGNNTAETFNIYTAAAAGTAGITGLNTSTEIVVTRNGTVIAELDNIEEITVNTFDLTANNGGGLTGGTNAGDTVAVFGDFTSTSLNYSTITVNGSSADDTVDISGLNSEHRVVLNSGGGTDSIVGGTRPQDVINVTPAGDAGNSSSGSGSGSGAGGGVDADGDGDHDDDTDTGMGSVTPPLGAHVDGLTLMGDETANLLSGNGGDDFALGNGGSDMLTTGDGGDLVFGGAGDDTVIAGGGNDMTYGEAGNDRIFAGAGDDLVDGGAGGDDAMGGAGDDVFVAFAGDGADRYFGDAGNDTLDMSAIMADIQANLGTGLSGSAVVGGVTDVLYSIENIVTGSGNDTITASGAHNVIDTGAGHDTIIFRSASDADGDTILNFQAGDKIDVGGFMGGAVTLVNGLTAAAGQIAVHFEDIGGENFTVLDGQSANGNHFQVDIKGHHALTGTDFAA